MLAGIIDVTDNAVLRDGNLLGRVLDTFVAAQLRAETVVARHCARWYHLRQEQGRHEVDLLAEVGAERVIGIEVKATSAAEPRGAYPLGTATLDIGARTRAVFDNIDRVLAGEGGSLADLVAVTVHLVNMNDFAG